MPRLARKSQDQWLKIVKAFETTDQSTDSFCSEHGISPDSLRKWIGKFKRCSKKPPIQPSTALIPIKPSLSTNQGVTQKVFKPLRASFADGTTLEWSCDTPPSYVASLLEILR